MIFFILWMYLLVITNLTETSILFRLNWIRMVILIDSQIDIYIRELTHKLPFSVNLGSNAYNPESLTSRPAFTLSIISTLYVKYFGL